MQVKRDDFLQPTVHSIICGARFTPECFEDDFKVKMGIKKTRNQLIPGSVPTIQPQRPKEMPEARTRTMESDQASTLQDTSGGKR